MHEELKRVKDFTSEEVAAAEVIINSLSPGDAEKIVNLCRMQQAIEKQQLLHPVARRLNNAISVTVKHNMEIPFDDKEGRDWQQVLLNKQAISKIIEP